jgi:hypothetical protein
MFSRIELAVIAVFVGLFVFAIVASAADPSVVLGIPQPSAAPTCGNPGFVADPNGNIYACNGTDLRAIVNVKGNGVFATASASPTPTPTVTVTPTPTATSTP